MSSISNFLLAVSVLLAVSIFSVSVLAVTESYNLDSPHNYYNNYDNTWSISKNGATQIRMHFSKIDVEDGGHQYDKVYTSARDVYSGYYTNMWSSWTSGSTATVRLKTDGSVTKWGFNIDQIDYRYPSLYINDKSLCKDWPNNNWCTTSDGYYDPLDPVYVKWAVRNIGPGGYWNWRTKVTTPGGNIWDYGTSSNYLNYGYDYLYPWGIGGGGYVWSPGSYKINYDWTYPDSQSGNFYYDFVVRGMEVNSQSTCSSKASNDYCATNDGHYRTSDTVWMFWRTWYVNHRDSCYNIRVKAKVVTPSGAEWTADSNGNAYDWTYSDCDGNNINVPARWWSWGWNPPNPAWKPGTYKVVYDIYDKKVYDYHKTFEIPFTIDAPSCSHLNGCSSDGSTLKQNCAWNSNNARCECTTTSKPASGDYCANSDLKEYRNYYCTSSGFSYSVTSSNYCSSQNTAGTNYWCNSQGTQQWKTDYANYYYCSNGNNQQPYATCSLKYPDSYSRNSLSDDCTKYSAWYCTSSGNREYRNYGCSSNNCNYKITQSESCMNGCIYQNSNAICKSLNLDLGFAPLEVEAQNDLKVNVNYTSVGIGGNKKVVVDLIRDSAPNCFKLWCENPSTEAECSIGCADGTSYTVNIVKDARASFSIPIIIPDSSEDGEYKVRLSIFEDGKKIAGAEAKDKLIFSSGKVAAVLKVFEQERGESEKSATGFSTLLDVSLLSNNAGLLLLGAAGLGSLGIMMFRNGQNRNKSSGSGKRGFWNNMVIPKNPQNLQNKNALFANSWDGLLTKDGEATFSSQRDSQQGKFENFGILESAKNVFNSTSNKIYLAVKNAGAIVNLAAAKISNLIESTIIEPLTPTTENPPSQPKPKQNEVRALPPLPVEEIRQPEGEKSITYSEGKYYKNYNQDFGSPPAVPPEDGFRKPGVSEDDVVPKVGLNEPISDNNPEELEKYLNQFYLGDSYTTTGTTLYTDEYIPEGEEELTIDDIEFDTSGDPWGLAWEFLTNIPPEELAKAIIPYAYLGDSEEETPWYEKLGFGALDTVGIIGSFFTLGGAQAGVTVGKIVARIAAIATKVGRLIKLGKISGFLSKFARFFKRIKVTTKGGETIELAGKELREAKDIGLIVERGAKISTKYPKALKLLSTLGDEGKEILKKTLKNSKRVWSDSELENYVRAISKLEGKSKSVIESTKVGARTHLNSINRLLDEGAEIIDIEKDFIVGGVKYSADIIFKKNGKTIIREVKSATIENFKKDPVGLDKAMKNWIEKHFEEPLKRLKELRKSGKLTDANRFEFELPEELAKDKKFMQMINRAKKELEEESLDIIVGDHKMLASYGG